VDVLVARCAGLDVGKDEVQACVRVPDPDNPGERWSQTRTFCTFTSGLEQLADWLAGHGVTQVVMEATGQYWKPIWYVLEDRGFELMLVNARHVKILPGRKTDVSDAAWLAQLLEHGLLRGSFVPPPQVRQLRDLTRLRKKFVQAHTAETQRVQKVCEDAGIKLGSVASDVLGVSGRAMLTALIGGERDPKVLAELARGRMRAKLPDLREALRGRFSEHHALMLRLEMEHLWQLEHAIGELDDRVDALMNQEPPDPPPGPGGTEHPTGTTPAGPAGDAAGGTGEGSAEDARSPFVRARDHLDTITGVAQRAAENLIGEIGIDMSCFPSPAHLASWACMCPGNNITGGKRRSGKTREGNPWIRDLLVECAWAASRARGTYLHAQFWKLAGRIGKKKAAVAVGHSILVIAWHLLSTDSDYVDLGGDYYTRHAEPSDRRRSRAVATLQALGYDVQLTPAA
jgi:transposase